MQKESVPNPTSLTRRAMTPETDYRRMFELIKASGWTGGYIGIEYEGGLYRDMGGDTSYLSNTDGILAMKKLIEKTIGELR